MDANQRSEANNQTNNGANEKWTPDSKGNTQSGPMDHTYPRGASEQGGQSGTGMAHAGGHDQAGLGGSPDGSGQSRQGDLPGGSMQTQQTGGSGPQQGITDSHQRQMEQHSGAWGLLEQPVGHRDSHSGTDVHPHAGNSQTTGGMNPQHTAQPELQGGSLGRHHDAPPGTYQAQAGPGNRQSDTHGEGTGMAIGPNVKRSQP